MLTQSMIYGHTKDRTKCMWVAKFMLVPKHIQLFVMVVKVSHPAEQCTADDV